MADEWLFAGIAAGVIFFLILPLICCCIFCGWCCSCCCGPRRDKAGAVHIHQPTSGPILPTTTIVQSNNSIQNQQQPPNYNYYNNNHGGYSQQPILDFNAHYSNNAYDPEQPLARQPSYYTRGFQQSQHYYYDQRYKPLTEFGLGQQDQYRHLDANHTNGPRNYLGHYDNNYNRQKMNQNQRNDATRGTSKYGPNVQQQQQMRR